MPPLPPLAAADRPTAHGEVAGGSDRCVCPDGAWTLVSTPEVSVRAAPVTHTVPCVGYVVEESSRAGKLLVDKPRREENSPSVSPPHAMNRLSALQIPTKMVK